MMSKGSKSPEQGLNTKKCIATHKSYLKRLYASVP